MSEKTPHQEEYMQQYPQPPVNYGPQGMLNQPNYPPPGNMQYGGPQPSMPTQNMGKQTQYGPYHYNYQPPGSGYQNPQYQGNYQQQYSYGSSMMNNQMPGYGQYGYQQMPGYAPYGHHHIAGFGPYYHHAHHGHHPYMYGYHGYGPHAYYGSPMYMDDGYGKHWLHWLHPGFFRNFLRSPGPNNFFRGVGLATVALLLAPSVAKILRPAAVSIINGVNDIVQEVKGVVDEAREDMDDVFANTNWDGFKLDDEKTTTKGES